MCVCGCLCVCVTCDVMHVSGWCAMYASCTHHVMYISCSYMSLMCLMHPMQVTHTSCSSDVCLAYLSCLGHVGLSVSCLVTCLVSACVFPMSRLHHTHVSRVTQIDLAHINRASSCSQVNTNPYIGCSSGLLRSIFTGMLEGAGPDPSSPDLRNQIQNRTFALHFVPAMQLLAPLLVVELRPPLCAYLPVARICLCEYAYAVPTCYA